MSHREAMAVAEEYVTKQLAAMPKLKGQNKVKVSAAERKLLVRSAAKLAKALQRD